MRVFAFEFITGGGLDRAALPSQLAQEGDRMLGALVQDLLRVAEVEVWITRDPRLPPLDVGERLIPAPPGADPFQRYAQGLAAADAVWPIAPETGGVLERLARIAVSRGTMLLGSRPEAIAIAASKAKTSAVLARAGIPVVASFSDPLALPDRPGPWVVKPDDGAGCIDTLRVADAGRARQLLAAGRAAKLVAQPWIEGDALSLSLVCHDGEAAVLSCNRQHVCIRNGRLGLDGVTVGALPVQACHVRLARAVARALPGLWGYVGVDLVQGDAGPVVIEVNPRLTTSYCGLSRAAGVNPAARVLALLQPRRRLTASPPQGKIRPQPVDIRLEARHA